MSLFQNSPALQPFVHWPAGVKGKRPSTRPSRIMPSPECIRRCSKPRRRTLPSALPLLLPYNNLPLGFGRPPGTTLTVPPRSRAEDMSRRSPPDTLGHAFIATRISKTRASRGVSPSSVFIRQGVGSRGAVHDPDRARQLRATLSPPVLPVLEYGAQLDSIY